MLIYNSHLKNRSPKPHSSTGYCLAVELVVPFSILKIRLLSK
ncbi:MAG: hypothetical protein JWO09_3420 [Bacteroidetes bacterium]|nr:hypothetical protein [Bacteroidota bacterium]